MPYSISILPKAIKALDRINEPFHSKIRQSILKLADNPRPFGYIKLKGMEAYRIRVGDYRIIYEISDAGLQVLVVEIGDRKNIYD